MTHLRQRMLDELQCHNYYWVSGRLQILEFSSCFAGRV